MYKDLPLRRRPRRNRPVLALTINEPGAQKAGSAPVPAHRLQPNTVLAEQGTKHPCFSVGDCRRAVKILHGRDDVEIVGIIRRVGEPMVREADPHLAPDDPRPQAAAFFFRDPCGLIVEIVQASSFAP